MAEDFRIRAKLSKANREYEKMLAGELAFSPFYLAELIEFEGMNYDRHMQEQFASRIEQIYREERGG